MPSGDEFMPTIASSPVLFSVPQCPLQSGRVVIVCSVGPPRLFASSSSAL